METSKGRGTYKPWGHTRFVEREKEIMRGAVQNQEEYEREIPIRRQPSQERGRAEMMMNNQRSQTGEIKKEMNQGFGMGISVPKNRDP